MLWPWNDPEELSKTTIYDVSAMSCATCKRTFQLKSVSKAKTRGFRKHSVTSHISPGITVADAIIKVHDIRFATNSEQCVCAGCFYRIRKCNTLRCSLTSAESDLCKFANVIPAPTTRKRKISTSTVPTTKRRVCSPFIWLVDTIASCLCPATIVEVEFSVTLVGPACQPSPDRLSQNLNPRVNVL